MPEPHRGLRSIFILRTIVSHGNDKSSERKIGVYCLYVDPIIVRIIACLKLVWE